MVVEIFRSKKVIESLEKELEDCKDALEIAKTDSDTLREENALISHEFELFCGQAPLSAPDRVGTITSLDAPPAQMDGGSLAPRAREGLKTLPSIFMVTMPKSATVYLMRLVSEGLGFRQFNVSSGGFPSNSLLPTHIRLMRHGNCFSSSHISPTALNVQLLEHFVGKFVIHLRDPRQALWSWVHHVDRLLRNGQREDLFRIAPMIPEEYETWSLAEKVDWQINNYLPNLVRWTQGWLSIYEEHNATALLCEYGGFIRDPKAYIYKILDHYNISPKEFRDVTIEKGEDVHFRSGDPDEWRAEMSAEQVRMATAYVPDDLLEYMNWER